MHILLSLEKIRRRCNHMKKMKNLIVIGLFVLTMGICTGCGSNDNNAADNGNDRNQEDDANVNDNSVDDNNNNDNDNNNTNADDGRDDNGGVVEDVGDAVGDGVNAVGDGIEDVTDDLTGNENHDNITNDNADQNTSETK
jgi:hypothetical protein